MKTVPCPRLIVLLAATLGLACPARAQAPAPSPAKPAAPDTSAARALLTAYLKDPNTVEVTLVTLRLAADADVVPLFVAYSSGSDRRLRLLATTALAELKGDAAMAALWERVRTDTAMAIRAQCLAVLIQTKSITPEQLQEALKIDDENVRYLAASGMVSAGLGAQVAPQLRKLVESRDVPTSALSRLCLLSLGQGDQLDPVTRIMSDPATPPAVVEMMLNQIQEMKVAAAAGLAEALAASTKDDSLRLQAFRAVAAISPDGARKVAVAIVKSDKTPFRVHLFRILIKHKDAPAQLAALAQGKDALAAMARFQIARADAGPPAAQAAAELVAAAHPIVLGHLLEALKEDVSRLGEKADAYTPVLLDIVRKVPKQEGRLRSEQELAAWAAMLVGDIGSPKALEGLKELLAGPYGESKRAVVGGMLRSKNPAAVALVTPLLDSPYDELMATSAIALARQNDQAAAKTLADMLAHSHRYRTDVRLLAGWYSLRLAGEHKAFIAEAARSVR